MTKYCFKTLKISSSGDVSTSFPPSKRRKILLETSNDHDDGKSNTPQISVIPAIPYLLNVLPSPRSWEEVPRSDWTVTFQGKEYKLHSFVLMRFDFFKGAERFPNKNSNVTNKTSANTLEILSTNLDTATPELTQRHSSETFEMLMDILYCDLPGKDAPAIDPEQAIPILHLADFLGLNHKPIVCEAIAFETGSKYLVFEADKLLAQLRDFEPLPRNMLRYKRAAIWSVYERLFYYCHIRKIVADLPLQEFVEILFCFTVFEFL